jgi:DNA invertase Pin-like site-specific DNA recombinase
LRSPTNMSALVAYYRVSTDRQGQSGLGLDAQREAVRRYASSGPHAIAAEFTEIESGKRHTNRPQLAAALAECRRHRATLVIAKLDRLARNVHFISGLMESGTEFLACDMPHATPVTIHILAAIAEHERKMISERTRAALAATKARGTRLGNPRLHEARIKAAQASRNVLPSASILTMMADMYAQGKSYRTIAATLNASNIRTGRNAPWYGNTVKAVLQRAA